MLGYSLCPKIPRESAVIAVLGSLCSPLVKVRYLTSELAKKAPQFIVFDMQGSGPWEVLHFRIESNESGPYVAVALRQFEKGKTPPWVKSLQSSLGQSESPEK